MLKNCRTELFLKFLRVSDKIVRIWIWIRTVIKSNGSGKRVKTTCGHEYLVRAGMERDEVGDVVDSVPEGRVGNKKPTQKIPKNPPKKTPKPHLKNPLKIGFLGFFLILNFFYENNTNFSL